MMWRPAMTPISERQGQVLEIVRGEFGGVMGAVTANYRVIADRLGWTHTTGVRDVLFALRAKGAIRTVGGTNSRPERWEVVGNGSP